MKKLLRLCLCLLILSYTRPSAHAQQLPESTQVTSELDSLFNAVFSKNAPGGAVLVAKGENIIFQQAFGLASLELGSPMRNEHVFRLGSLTKQFTAMCILQLVESGKLSLKDPVSKYLPDYPRGNEITIEALLTHTAGVANYTGLPSFTEKLKRQDLSPAALVDLFKSQPLDYAPGTRHLYSNSGYVLLGYLIEKISGQTYSDYISEHIFKPLGMNSSGYEQGTAIVPGKIPGYRGNNGTYQQAPYLSMTLPYAAGSLYSNTADLFSWYRALASGKVISHTNIQKAFCNYQMPNGMSAGYGYGWETGNVQGHPSVKHTGVINGFFTDVVYLPKEQLLVIMLSNNEYIGDLDIPASKAAAIALGKPYMFNQMQLSKAILKTYSGVYTNPVQGERLITYQDGELVFHVKGGGKTRLIPYAKDQFYLEGSLNTVNFTPDNRTPDERKDQKNAARQKALTMTGTGASSRWTRQGHTRNLERVRLPLQTLQSFTGKYRFGNMVFEVLLRKGALYGRVGSDEKELIPYTENKCYAKDLDATLIFNRDLSGKTIGLTKIQNSEMSAERIAN